MLDLWVHDEIARRRHHELLVQAERFRTARTGRVASSRVVVRRSNARVYAPLGLMILLSLLLTIALDLVSRK